MIFTIRSDTPPNYTLCENDTAKSILQNITLIIGTKRGTVPMYREFGIPMAFLDRPAIVAATVLAAEVEEALERFEPRCTPKNIRCEANELGEMVIILEVEI